MSSASSIWDPKPFEDRLLLLSIDEVFSEACKRALHQFPDAFSSLREVARIAGELRMRASQIARLAVKLGRYVGLNAGEQDLLYVAAMVHDVGSVLVKPDRGGLGETSGNQLHDHTMIGRQLIIESFFSTPVLTETIAHAVLCHHERWDGEGYPLKLRGEKIPVLSRILAIADEFHAQVSRGGGIAEQVVERACESIFQERGRAFDPDCVDAFIRHHQLLTVGYRGDLQLSTDE